MKASRSLIGATAAAVLVVTVGNAVPAGASSAKKTIRLTAVTTKVQDHNGGGEPYMSMSFKLEKKGKVAGHETFPKCQAVGLSLHCVNGTATIKHVGRNLDANMIWTSNPDGTSGGPGTGVLTRGTHRNAPTVAQVKFKIDDPGTIKRGTTFPVVIKKL